MSAARRVWRGPALAALAIACGCASDVSLHLLATAPVVQAGSGGLAGVSGSEAAGNTDSGGASGEAPVCLDGEPCSGLMHALHFRGAYDRVEIASSAALDLPQDYTVEAWVLPKSYAAGHGIFNRWIAGVGDIQLSFGTPEPLPQLELPSAEPVPSHVLASWGFVRADLWLTVVAPALPEVDHWHHLATSYGGGSYRLYVDGKLVGSVDATEPVANPASTLYLGATARHEGAFDSNLGTLYWPPLDGFIGDVRISSSSRYSADFTPEARLVSDLATLALWRLDEGSGVTAADSGPSQLAGSIFGATWELAPLRGAASAP